MALPLPDTTLGNKATPGAVDIPTLLGGLREVIFVVDAQFRKVHYVTPTFDRVWGRSCASLHADPLSSLLPVITEDKPRLLADIARLQQGEDQISAEYRIVRADGKIRRILLSATPIRDASGGVHQISGVALDLTELKEVQQALRESESRFHLLCDALADGIIISEDGIVLGANGGLARMLGYELDELIGKNPTGWVAPDFRELVAQRMADGFEGSYEIVALRKDGGRVMLEATARMTIEEGRVRRITALRDITEKRKLEEQFRHAQKMEAIGRLAGGVAHDFNNLLTVISSYAELVTGDMTPSDPRRLDIAEIQKAATTAATLTRQLLAFSRQQVAEPQCLALEDVISNAGKLLRRLLGEDVEFIPPVTEQKTLVRMDPGQLEQIIMNLAVNARDAMPAGGMLSVETGVVTLTDQYATQHWPIEPGRYAMLAVTDTGIGMTPEVRSRIFEPFFTTKEAGKGTGLGLATVYGIVKQNKGFIWVYSEPGRGSTFKIYLPLETSLLPAESTGVDNPEDLRGTETILLVEDYAGLRGAARHLLLRQGYTVLECTDGESALDLIARTEPRIDLLLTDVVMPVMSGRELAERFRMRFPGAKILYMSGYPDQAIVSHGILNPGVAYLQKPFSSTSLSRKVRQVLDSA